MPLYIPGTDDLYEAGLDNLIQATLNRNGVITGCQVVAHAGPDMGVRVGGGSIQGGNARVAVAQTDLVVAANPGANARVDLVSINFTTGVPTITAGVAAATPKPPALPATDILAGYVTVPAAAVNIQNANITDRRLFIPSVYEDIVGVRVPNLVVNSDFGRRTSWQLAMPEAFADLNAWTLEAGAALGAAAANIFTAGNIGAWRAKWNGPAGFFRDGRFTVAVKFEDDTGAAYHLFGHYTDGNNYVYLRFTGGGVDTVELRKNIAGVDTIVATAAFNPTATIWYWLEIEFQGTTVIGKLWETGTAVAGTTVKTASTLRATVSGTIADAAVQTGVPAVGSTAGVAAKWGGFAASPGGFYFETWLPESWQGTTLHTGTLGGQAVVYDDTADAGPQAKQWAMKAYVPATSRGMTLLQDLPDGSVIPSTTYTASIYMKVSGLGGAGTLVASQPVSNRSDKTNVTVPGRLNDGGAAAWTRRSVSFDSGANARRGQMFVYLNPDGTATGTAYFQLPQYEQGYVAHPWRPAPADDAPIVWDLSAIIPNVTTTSTNLSEPDPRNLALNLFLPWDGKIVADVALSRARNNTANDGGLVDVSVDGAYINATFGTWVFINNANTAALDIPAVLRVPKALTAGKHRVAVGFAAVTGGTFQIADGSRLQQFIVTAYRGK
jgi:hypothetical protein